VDNGGQTVAERLSNAVDFADKRASKINHKADTIVFFFHLIMYYPHNCFHWNPQDIADRYLQDLADRYPQDHPHNCHHWNLQDRPDRYTQDPPYRYPLVKDKTLTL